MPGLVWKTVYGKRTLVLRWMKRINGKLKITNEIYVGDIDRIADIIQNPMKDIHVISLDFGTTTFVRMVDQRIGLKDIVESLMNHKGKDVSPGDYMPLFITNHLSDSGSKNSVEKWMINDYTSTMFEKRGTQMRT
jgi:hypothetical protein